MGKVLSCIPGRLVFVETEDERFILERHDPLEKREYVRFVVGRKDEDSHAEQGIFQAAALALERHDITVSDADELNELRAWFNKKLKKPTSFGVECFIVVSLGSRPTPLNISPASGRWARSWNATAST
jgi:hypothetical protein